MAVCANPRTTAEFHRRRKNLAPPLVDGGTVDVKVLTRPRTITTNTRLKQIELIGRPIRDISAAMILQNSSYNEDRKEIRVFKQLQQKRNVLDVI